ncbi:MAG: hypothetical protein HY764_03205 [Candidatus Portnoybacteria bacterium]|nr:hypothetical protein [Candidatus Portnoybacteria bacterium]
MQQIKLKVIPVPKEGSRAVMVLENNNKIKGEGGAINLICGNCNSALVENINLGQISNIVIKCQCGAYNDIPKNNR